MRGQSRGRNLPLLSSIIQVKKTRTDREPHIHEIMVDKIKNHHRFFAPIENVQPVLLKSGKDETTTEYVRATRREIGAQTLEERIEDLAKKLPSSVSEKVEDYYEHIVEGLSKLKDAQIVHFNIQPNNILYSDSEYCPIITDFGHAFLYKDETVGTIFCKPHPPNRCIEAICIATIVEDYAEWKTNKVNITKLEEVITQHFTSEEEEEEEATEWKTYIRKKFAKKEGDQVVNELMKNWHTWDLYSVNRIFMRFKRNIPIIKKQHNPGAPYEKLVFG